MGAASVEPAPLMVADTLEVLEPAAAPLDLLVLLELLLEPQAATTSAATNATAMPPRPNRLLCTGFLLNHRDRQAVSAPAGLPLLLTCESVVYDVSRFG